MCTVSFVRANGAVIITSNRDENIRRENAVKPAFYESKDKRIIFPKDPKAGGTWFAATDTGVVCVLLNGAFEKHIPAPPYRKSRGLVLLEIIEHEDPLGCFREIDLEHIEPFTLILYQPGLLCELRWNGNTKFEKQPGISGNYIWSSATLYSDEVIAHRQQLFEQFLLSEEPVTAMSIQAFHANDNGDAENGFIISRDTGLITFSITQAVIQHKEIQFLHADLLEKKQYSQMIPVLQPSTDR